MKIEWSTHLILEQTLKRQISKAKNYREQQNLTPAFKYNTVKFNGTQNSGKKVLLQPCIYRPTTETVQLDSSRQNFSQTAL